jgi:hypothetical protein
LRAHAIIFEVDCVPFCRPPFTRQPSSVNHPRVDWS